MKREQQPASQPTHAPVRHQFEHEVPTVIHHPEQDMTALGRFFAHAYQNQGRFWGWVGAIVVGFIAIVILASYLSTSQANSSDVWTRLDEAKKPSEKEEIAKENPTSAASNWALLQAAGDYFQDGFGDLPNNRDAALPALKKALDLFKQVADSAPKESPLARHAALGVARSYEARNELPKAIEQYKLVAKNWPGTAEAKVAETLAKTLEEPTAAAFYKDLYAYQSPKATLPDVGTGSLPSSMSLPDLDLSKMGLGGASSAPGATGSSFPFLPPPPPATPSPVNAPPASPKADTKTPASDAAAPKPAAPAPADAKASAAPKTDAKPEAKPAPSADSAKKDTTPKKP